MMNALTVTIVGVGPRGLTVLDRLVEAYRSHSPNARLVIHLIDPGNPGEGVHRSRQSRHLLTNTPASMLTIFTHQPFPGASARPAGPSLSEWAIGHGYRRRGSDFVISDDARDAPISDDDCVPRSMLGEYLGWFYAQLIQAIPKGVEVVHNRLAVVNIIRDAGLAKSVTMETNYDLHTDYLVITCGHGSSRDLALNLTYKTFVEIGQANNSNLEIVHASNHGRISSISADAVVALQGFGLTAHDVIAQLTAGRGGAFVETDDCLKYEKSGFEPKTLLFSRSGLPHCARALNQKPLGSLQETHFFTSQAVARLRSKLVAEGGSGQIDYVRDVLPLLLKEMSFVHACVRSGRSIDPRDYAPDQDDDLSIKSLFAPIVSGNFKNLGAYQRYLVEYLKRDLREAMIGNAKSPLKAAVEVIRDTRLCFREIVEHGGLSPESHAEFHRDHHSTLNRLAFGPPIRRNRELLALIEAGVVEIAGGPGCTLNADVDSAKFRISTKFADETDVRYADVLIEAQIDPPKIDGSASMLFQNLLSSGTIRPYQNGWYVPGGIDIDRFNHPRTKSGEVISNVWVFGHPVEGPNYFTNALPIPLLPSRHVSDADRCVTEIFEGFGQFETSKSDLTVSVGGT